MAIDPSFAINGSEWQIGPVGPVESPEGTAPAAGGGSFGGVLADQIGKLDALQQQGDSAAQGLATGQAHDPSAAVMAIERSRLAMQLASQIRTKGVEALQDIFHTQV